MQAEEEHSHGRWAWKSRAEGGQVSSPVEPSISSLEVAVFFAPNDKASQRVAEAAATAADADADDAAANVEEDLVRTAAQLPRQPL